MFYQKKKTILPIRYFVFCISLLYSNKVTSQTAWPSQSWSSAVNLTSILNPSGITELSGLFWNDVTKRLYTISNIGQLKVLQYNSGTNNFSLIAANSVSGGPEGITQVNLNANEFYDIDENNYLIRKYTHPSDFSTLTLAKSWNILAAPSPMTNTGNTGPEGITFIPDSFLSAIGFISQSTGSLYTSVKGMGGLIFIAHQDQGYIWVFDLNPNVSNDFAYVGKYQTNKTESCDLAFDQTTGLLYILHNISGNSLEATNLTTTTVSGSIKKFVTKAEYAISNPSGTNVNIEGFAISRRCPDSTNMSAWLCRDVSGSEALSYQQDCLRWFKPFTAPGSCVNYLSLTLNIQMYLQGFYLGAGVMKPSINAVLYPLLCDTVVVELHLYNSNHALAYSSKSTISTAGSGNFSFPQIVAGSYYIVIKHRNSIETWSSLPVMLSSAFVNYSFTNLPSKAYQNQLKDMGGGIFALYSGDVNQNGIIDSTDVSSISSKAKLFSTGYLNADLTGDSFIESSDFSLVENNAKLVITVAHP
jgi:hypothetical protein